MYLISWLSSDFKFGYDGFQALIMMQKYRRDVAKASCQEFTVVDLQAYFELI